MGFTVVLIQLSQQCLRSVCYIIVTVWTLFFLCPLCFCLLWICRRYSLRKMLQEIFHRNSSRRKWRREGSLMRTSKAKEGQGKQTATEVIVIVYMTLLPFRWFVFLYHINCDSISWSLGMWVMRMGLAQSHVQSLALQLNLQLLLLVLVRYIRSS